MKPALEGAIASEFRKVAIAHFFPSLGGQWVGEVLRVSLFPMTVDPSAAHQDLRLSVQLRPQLRIAHPGIETSGVLANLTFTLALDLNGVLFEDVKRTDRNGMAYFLDVPTSARCSLAYKGCDADATVAAAAAPAMNQPSAGQTNQIPGLELASALIWLSFGPRRRAAAMTGGDFAVKEAERSSRSSGGGIRA